MRSQWSQHTRADCLQVKAGYGRLLALNRKEWPWAITGCLGSLGLGVLMPGFALALSHIITVYFNPNFHEMEVSMCT